MTVSDVPQPGRPTVCLLDHRHSPRCAPIPRGESELISYRTAKPARRPRRTPWREVFVRWWSSHAA